MMSVLVEQLTTITRQEREALDVLIRLLQKRFGEQLLDVVLFGSKARGDATPQSDVDVLIILDHPSARDQSDALGLSFDVWMETDVFLSLRVKRNQAWEESAAMQTMFYRNVQQDGVSLLLMTM
jgi:predicted nucleotidyltransferase